MSDERIQIDVELSGAKDAEKQLDAVADAAEVLEDVTPEVTVTADTAAASSDLAAVAADAQKLDGADAEIVIRAQIDAAKRDLKELQSELERTEQKGQDANRQLDRTTGGGDGLNTRGNAIADLTGPLGEASGAASDFAGVFDGLGDIGADVAGKLGASAETAGKVAGALGGLGIVVAAGAAVWSLWSAKQEEAKKKAAELLETNEKLRESIRKGDREAAAADFAKGYQDAIDKGKELGLSLEAIVGHVTGVADAIPNAREELARLEEQYAANQKAYLANPALPVPDPTTVEKYREAVAALDGARTAYEDNGDTIAKNAEEAERLGKALVPTTAAERKFGDETVTTTGRLEAHKIKLGDVITALDILAGHYSEDDAFADFRQSIQETIDKLAEQDVSLEAAGVALRDLKQDAINLAAQVEGGLAPALANKIAIQIDTAQTVADLQRVYDKLAEIKRLHDQIGNDYGFGRTGSGSGAAAGPTSVVVNMPTGARGADVVRALSGQTRRSGGRYGAAVVHYARR